MASKKITEVIEKFRPSFSEYEELYRWLHANPELSTLEYETAKRITEWIGAHCPKTHVKPVIKPEIGKTGTAVVIENGDGPTVLLRADTDALPVEEKTGLPYASTKRMKDMDGIDQPVMHACGHDVHITTLLAAAELLTEAAETWSGTLILIFQPAEEKGLGAQAMVDDGLYTKHGVPIPDVILGAHVMPYPAGTIGMVPGAMASAADSVKVLLQGRGGHGSMPQFTVDPVVMGAYAVTRLQSIVAREVPPRETAVVTVASLQAGQAENVIPAQAVMKYNVRTWSEERRTKVLASVKRIIEAECQASNAPEPATFTNISSFPLLWNDEEVTEKLATTMSAHFGDAFNPKLGPLQGSEDFGILGTAVKKPSCFWMYGGTDPKLYERLKQEDKLDELPYNHSAFFAPVIQPTLKVAVDGYAVAALTWLLKT